VRRDAGRQGALPPADVRPGRPRLPFAFYCGLLCSRSTVRPHASPRALRRVAGGPVDAVPSTLAVVRRLAQMGPFGPVRLGLCIVCACAGKRWMVGPKFEGGTVENRREWPLVLTSPHTTSHAGRAPTGFWKSKKWWTKTLWR